MHGLEVCRHKVCVSPGHLQRGMPEYLLQMEHGAAAPEIVHRESVPKRMERPDRRSKSQLSTKQLYVPQNIVAAQPGLHATCEQ